MNTPEARHFVRICMIKGDDTDMVLESVEESQPHVKVIDRATYWMLEAQDEIILDVSDIGDRVGRKFTTQDVLVSFSSFVGRADVNGDRIRITSELPQIEA